MSRHPLLTPLTDDVPRFACSLTDSDPDSVRVRASGALSLATLPQLMRLLLQVGSEAPLVVLDLRGLASVDVSAVRIIAYASVRARRAGRRIVVVRGPPQVDRVFALTWASSVVEIVDQPTAFRHPPSAPYHGQADFARSPEPATSEHGASNG